MPEIKLIDDVRARLNRGRAGDRQYPARKALHFRDSQHDVRKFYAARIAKAALTTAVVLIKKRDLLSGNETSVEQKNIRKALYHSATMALIETISHYCANEHAPGDAQAIMHSKSMGLQIADAVTSSYFYGVEASVDGFTEDAYVRLLLPCAYRHLGELFGHGAKFKHCSTTTLAEMQLELSRWER